MPKGRAANLIGRTYGRLHVFARSDKDSSRGRYWRCRCRCGEERVVRGDNLTSGKTLSCGCYLQDIRAGLVTGIRVGRPGGGSPSRSTPTNGGGDAQDAARYDAMGDF